MQKSPTGKIVNLQYKTLLAKIVEDVTNSLSEEYILKLRNYFDTEALTVFIMHHVDMELTKIILEKNIIQE
jgi:flavorubredoxin